MTVISGIKTGSVTAFGGGSVVLIGVAFLVLRLRDNDSKRERDRL
jgi:hypothetical protein